MVKKEAVAINTAAVIQGIVLVAFPAVGAILTSPNGFNFSNVSYGSLFIPQAVLSIAASAMNPSLSRRFGSKCIFLIGLIFNLISMILFASSALAMNNQVLSYYMLFIATGCLGIGFGFVVPTLNSMSALLNPTKVDSTLLILNALLGIGTALAPFLTSLFVAFGYWWQLPILISILLIGLLFASIPLNLPGGKISISRTSSQARFIFPTRFWLFAAFAMLYGVIETLNGNWLSIYMNQELHTNVEIQSIALTAFWGVLTFGRVFFAWFQRFVKDQTIFQISPFIVAAAFGMIFFLSSEEKYWAIAAFGLSGFGCAVLLPLIISFGNAQLKAMVSSIPGLLIAFYLLGYGIAAFGVGPLEKLANIHLSEVYAIGAILAIILGIMSLFIVRRTEKITS